MRSEDRKRSTQRSYGNDERPSRVQGGRTRDAGASGEYSGEAWGRGDRDELGGTRPSAVDSPDDLDAVASGPSDHARDQTRARAPDADSGRRWPDDSVSVSETSEDSNIVPENERSQR